jgi:hypothetical protein
VAAAGDRGRPGRPLRAVVRGVRHRRGASAAHPAHRVACLLRAHGRRISGRPCGRTARAGTGASQGLVRRFC